MVGQTDGGGIGVDVQHVVRAIHDHAGLALGQRLGVIQISNVVGNHNALDIIQVQLALAQSLAGVGVAAGSQGAVLHCIVQNAAEEDLSDHLTGSGSVEVTAGDILQDALALSDSSGLELPALRIVELAGLAITQSTQDHDHQLIAGDLCAGLKGGGGSALDDLSILAVVNVTTSPVIAVKVGELALRHVGVVVQVFVVHIAGGNTIDKYRSLCAVQGVGGLEGTIFKALENFQLVQHVDSSLIRIAVVHVGELSGAGGSHEREAHNEGQHHCENLFQISHSGFFLLLIF